MKIKRNVMAPLWVMMALLLSAPAWAATVTNTNDSGAGSLRKAIADAAAGDTINFTAGLGTMQISDEVLALRTMSINPVGYLVAPRLIAILVMLPCLTIFANVVGMAGGCAMGLTFGLDPWGYINDSIHFLKLQDLFSGVAKSGLFAVVICIVSCYMAFKVEGGPEGLARNTMLSVVTQLVLLIMVDGFVAAFLQAVM